MTHRPRLAEIGLSTGKKARLHRILHSYGLGNGTALQIGLAEKFFRDYAGEVPLILKLNGKTDIPSDAAALSPLHARVADAVRLGVDAVGYPLYVGTPAQEQDFAQLRAVRTEAHRLGMPLVVWAYPRGEAMEAGATGLVFGRNVGQRDHDDSLRLVFRLKEILAKYPSD